MAFALEHGEPVDAGLRRMADELLAVAVGGLQRTDDPAAGVHTARKAVKRLRALIRVGRSGLKRGDYRRMNTTARDAARRLAGIRDADIVSTTLEALVTTATDPAVYAELRSQLSAAPRAASAEAIAQAGDDLAGLRGDVATWQLRAAGWDVLAGGLQDTYRRGAAAMERAAGKPRVATLHEWRKSVKYLWHAAEILRPTWPPVLAPFGDELHRLSDLLGDDHDLAILQERLDALGPAEVPPGTAELVAARHHDLRAAAFGLGLRVYAETPAAFTTRIAGYYAAWAAG